MPRLLRCRFWKSGSWRAAKSAWRAAGRIGLAHLDLDDVGAPIGELAHAGRAGAHPRQVEHDEPGERRRRASAHGARVPAAARHNWRRLESQASAAMGGDAIEVAQLALHRVVDEERAAARGVEQPLHRAQARAARHRTSSAASAGAARWLRRSPRSSTAIASRARADGRGAPAAISSAAALPMPICVPICSAIASPRDCRASRVGRRYSSNNPSATPSAIAAKPVPAMSWRGMRKTGAVLIARARPGALVGCSPSRMRCVRHERVLDLEALAAGAGEADDVPVVDHRDVALRHEEEAAPRRLAVLVEHAPPHSTQCAWSMPLE